MINQKIAKPPSPATATEPTAIPTIAPVDKPTALVGSGRNFSARAVPCTVTRAVAARGFVFVYRSQADFTADGKGVNFFGADDVAAFVFPALENLAFFGLVVPAPVPPLTLTSKDGASSTSL